VTINTIGVEDMVFHSLFIGSTGAGKTNTLLYWLQRLSRDRREVDLVLIDSNLAAAEAFKIRRRAETESLTTDNSIDLLILQNLK
jgi:hypothetical protein